MAHGLSRFAARGIFPDHGSNPCPLHWQADSYPLRHQGSPRLTLLITTWLFAQITFPEYPTVKTVTIFHNVLSPLPAVFFSMGHIAVSLISFPLTKMHTLVKRKLVVCQHFKKFSQVDAGDPWAVLRLQQDFILRPVRPQMTVSHLPLTVAHIYLCPIGLALS